MQTPFLVYSDPVRIRMRIGLIELVSYHKEQLNLAALSAGVGKMIPWCEWH